VLTITTTIVPYAANKFAVDRAGAGLETANDTRIYPIVGIRMKTGKERTLAVTGSSVVCTAAASFRWVLLQNPTITGNLIWTPPNETSVLEVCRSTTKANEIGNEGIVLAAGYDLQAFRSEAAQMPDVLRFSGGTLFLGVQNLVAGVNTYFGSISWQE
jgi:hypothetical protein